MSGATETEIPTSEGGILRGAPLKQKKKRTNRVKERNYEIYVLELMEVKEKSSTNDTSNTMGLLDMPEGEPDDESVVFPKSPVIFSEKYREAILVLDRVYQKPEIIAEIASYKFKLRLDDNSELNFMFKDLCECLLQQSESVSQTELTKDPVVNFAPVWRVIHTNLTVVGHTFIESFVIIEDTVLIIAAVGRSTITKLLPYSKLYEIFRIDQQQRSTPKEYCVLCNQKRTITKWRKSTKNGCAFKNS